MLYPATYDPPPTPPSSLDFWAKYDLDMFVWDSLKYSPTVRHTHPSVAPQCLHTVLNTKHLMQKDQLCQNQDFQDKALV